MVCSLLIVSMDCEARRFRSDELPNGNTFSCANCHNNPSGGGSLNAFGTEVETNHLDAPGSNGHVVWSNALAILDSDGDRFTNGQEMQDSEGTWSTGNPAPGDAEQVTNPGDASSHANYTVNITPNDSYGDILTDENGNALYFFTKDAFGNSVCNGTCEELWPVFYKESLVAGDSLNPEDFGVSTRDDMSKQITYKGWPLYYYIDDITQGDVNGEDVDHAWYVAKPDYTIMLADNQLVGLDGIAYNGNYEAGQEVIQYFVDAYGRTLYTFSEDTENTNTFTAADFSNNGTWPILEMDLVAAPSVIDPSMFETIDVFGHTQLTYKGWPLYYFGQDSLKRGSNKGISFPTPGIWPVALTDMDAPTGIEGKHLVQPGYSLDQNYPNPFYPATTISFTLPVQSMVNLQVFNLNGQLVTTLVNRKFPAGTSHITWDGKDMNGGIMDSGLYFYRLKSQDFVQVKSMTLIE